MKERKTITRAQIVEAIYQEVGLSRNESTSFLEKILETMVTALEKEGSLKISSFGSFAVRNKSKRIGRNPKTGEEVLISPRRVLAFRPSQVLKTHINERKA